MSQSKTDGMDENLLLVRIHTSTFCIIWLSQLNQKNPLICAWNQVDASKKENPHISAWIQLDASKKE
jgi:hypothetical protein